ncbi:MAG: hypothetical protein OXC62_11965 [Aestuariivita sp.]|nr:hypothetical protein [Aestuariivita sp.]
MSVNYVVISRTFTGEDRQMVAQLIANAVTAHPNHGIDHIYSMDITDMISGRGPQQLTLPKPKQENSLPNKKG